MDGQIQFQVKLEDISVAMLVPYLPVVCRFSIVNDPFTTEPITTKEELEGFMGDLNINPQWKVKGWYRAS